MQIARWIFGFIIYNCVNIWVLIYLRNRSFLLWGVYLVTYTDDTVKQWVARLFNRGGCEFDACHCLYTHVWISDSVRVSAKTLLWTKRFCKQCSGIQIMWPVLSFCARLLMRAFGCHCRQVGHLPVGSLLGEAAVYFFIMKLRRDEFKECHRVIALSPAVAQSLRLVLADLRAACAGVEQPFPWRPLSPLSAGASAAAWCVCDDTELKSPRDLESWMLVPLLPWPGEIYLSAKDRAVAYPVLIFVGYWKLSLQHSTFICLCLSKD